MNDHNKKVLRGIGRVLAGALIFNALSPLSVLAQDKGSVNPAAQRQLQQLAALNQKIEQAKAEKSRGPAERVSQDFKQAQDLVHSLSADQGARTLQDHNELRAIGPNMRIEVRRQAAVLSDERRAEQQARLKRHLEAIHDAQAEARAEFEQTGRELNTKGSAEQTLNQ